MLCDIILLNFLKGADQYKAKKFEEVCSLLVRLYTVSGAYKNTGLKTMVKVPKWAIYL